ncbi:APC family permease [Chryseobacterium echinoideorum]|uniref:APC family permease n=1 Tax=Chryseobacterium echinoideorum TaxID=1549648 RepID=UPI001184A518|nr:APC family permease [Chryseobacterium echinoideorum]
MELRIKPFPKNSFPKRGLLIKGSSPSLWLREMDLLDIDLNEVRSFPIPSNEPNVLYGCFLVFRNLAPSEIGRNSYFQCVDDKFFIPENTVFYPKVIPEEWQNIEAQYLIMHPEFGWVKLNEEIDWLSLIQDPELSAETIRKPLKGVEIPSEIKSFMVEMDDEKVLESLEKPKTEEEWMKNLPFDMKKVMAGNKKEIEKYLKYIEKYPERAVELGVPLDIMGTSRGDRFSKFRFANSWWSKIFGQSNSSESSGSEKYRWVFWTFLIVLALARIGFYFNEDEHQNGEKKWVGNVESQKETEKILAFKSGVTEINQKIDSLYRKRRGKLMNDFTMAQSESFRGKSMKEVEKDIQKYREDERKSKDSLKGIYNLKIEEVVVRKMQKVQDEVLDSLKKSGTGNQADEGILKSVLTKKQKMMEDSLGRFYGTIEPQSEIPENPQSYLEGNNLSSEDQPESVSLSEILGLIVLIAGGIALYFRVFKKKQIHLGGDHLSQGMKIFLMALLVGMLVYIFYPLVEMFGYNWLFWILVIAVILVLYRLFSEDKTLLNTDKDE